MIRGELQRLEGVWTGTERIVEGTAHTEATARLVFQTVFDGRFMLCDYVQTVPDRPTSVGHAVFRRDDVTDLLTVTWFRSPAATTSQQAIAIAEGEKLIFLETIGGRTTRMTYSLVLDKMSVRTEVAIGDDEWTPILEGTFRRR